MIFSAIRHAVNDITRNMKSDTSYIYLALSGLRHLLIKGEHNSTYSRTAVIGDYFRIESHLEDLLEKEWAREYPKLDTIVYKDKYDLYLFKEMGFEGYVEIELSSPEKEELASLLKEHQSEIRQERARMVFPDVDKIEPVTIHI